jgi:beta-glucosidase
MEVQMIKLNAKRILFIFISVLFLGICSCQKTDTITTPKLGKAPLKEVIANMTLEEKAGLVVGTGMDMSFLNNGDTGNTEPEADQGPKRLVPGAAGTTYAIPRLGISPMVLADGPAGLRINPTREGDNHTTYCTAFPVATLLASTWDTELVYEVGVAVGSEVIEYGVGILLAPGLNLHRNPLCGRNFEYYSEDPLVTGKMTAAMVKGVQSKGVGTTIKHFVANNTETNRMALDTIVSERTLREIYLEGFRIAVEEAQPWAVMSAYNSINGVYCSESHDLLTKILRNDWGFKGLVMTDWGAGSDVVAQMKAGNDLIMPGDEDQSAAIVAAVKEGRLEEAVLDVNVERILNIVLQSPRYKGYAFSNRPDLTKHAELTRRAAAGGMVLLKNDNFALPLDSDVKTIAAFGNTSYDIIIGGTGSGDVNEAYSVALEEGMKNAGYTVDEKLGNTYVAYLEEEKANRPQRGFFEPEVPIAEMELGEDLINKSAEENDCAIITIGRNSGEFRDRVAGEGDFNLTKPEISLINNVTQAFHARGKKSIVILNIGGVVETASWRDIPDAILLAWQAGQETGNSMADVISGKVNPSGKLATTFPMAYADVPSAKNFPGIVTGSIPENQEEQDIPGLPKPVPSEIIYEEGIYVGYRYYDAFQVPTAYEFGYGLSYTTFEYSDLKLSSETFNKTITVTVDVKNTGKRAGREVVQVYVSTPGETLTKPEKELKSFAKTGLLGPGESQTLSFVMDSRSLASYDSIASSWVAEAGKYVIKIGASSKDIRQSASFLLEKALTVKTASKALAPSRNINEWTPGT